MRLQSPRAVISFLSERTRFCVKKTAFCFLTLQNQFKISYGRAMLAPAHRSTSDHYNSDARHTVIFQSAIRTRRRTRTSAFCPSIATSANLKQAGAAIGRPFPQTSEKPDLTRSTLHRKVGFSFLSNGFIRFSKLLRDPFFLPCLRESARTGN